MSEYDEEYDDFYYDDGRFCDDDDDDEGRRSGYDIPTYDELDLEGRYYTYGSREEYNEWRNEQIQALKNPMNTQSSNPSVDPAKEDSGTGCLIVFPVVLFLSLLYFCL